MTDFNAKDDSTLANLHFTDDKTFVIPRDKIMVITQADQHISNYYEVILNKWKNKKKKLNRTLSASEEEKNIYRLADQMDQIDATNERRKIRLSSNKI